MKENVVSNKITFIDTSAIISRFSMVDINYKDFCDGSYVELDNGQVATLKISLLRNALVHLLMEMPNMVDGQIVYVLDGYTPTIRAKEIFPKYFPGLVYKKKDFKNINMTKEMSKWYYKLITHKVLTESKAFNCAISEGYEADDVIYSLVMDTRAKTPDCEIQIVSSDRDYMQLIDSKTSLLIPGEHKTLVRYTIDNYEDIPIAGNFIPYNMCLFAKIMYGDRSDNIPHLYKDARDRVRLAFHGLIVKDFDMEIFANPRAEIVKKLIYALDAGYSKELPNIFTKGDIISRYEVIAPIYSDSINLTKRQTKINSYAEFNQIIEPYLAKGNKFEETVKYLYDFRIKSIERRTVNV